MDLSEPVVQPSRFDLRGHPQIDVLLMHLDQSVHLRRCMLRRSVEKRNRAIWPRWIIWKFLVFSTKQWNLLYVSKLINCLCGWLMASERCVKFFYIAGCQFTLAFYEIENAL